MTAPSEPVDLRPCAHCGGEAECWGQDHPKYRLVRVGCRTCHACGANHKTRAAAFAAWNRRVPLAASPPSTRYAVRSVKESDGFGPIQLWCVHDDGMAAKEIARMGDRDEAEEVARLLNGRAASQAAEAMEAALRMSKGALLAWSAMPDAGFTNTDPRWPWWYSAAAIRQDSLGAIDLALALRAQERAR